MRRKISWPPDVRSNVDAHLAALCPDVLAAEQLTEEWDVPQDGGLTPTLKLARPKQAGKAVSLPGTYPDITTDLPVRNACVLDAIDRHFIAQGANDGLKRD